MLVKDFCAKSRIDCARYPAARIISRALAETNSRSSWPTDMTRKVS